MFWGDPVQPEPPRPPGWPEVVVLIFGLVLWVVITFIMGGHLSG